MATAKRKPVEDTDVPETTGYNMGFDASDLTLPRMRVVGKDARLVELGVAKPGDIAIGSDAEDTESNVFPNPGGVKFYILGTPRINYACGFNGPDGVWDEGDPEMPVEAKKQYHYTLLVPDHDTILPVLYTANGTAAKVFRNVNTKLAAHCMSGMPYELAFEMRTKVNTASINGQQKSWPGPVILKAEADPDEVKIAAGLHREMFGTPKTQIEAGTADEPTY